MAIVVPISLTQPCSTVTRVISLFPVLPIFPNSIRAAQLASLDLSVYPRNTTTISKGFPHSLNLDPAYNLTSNSTQINVNPGVVFPLPANAYAVVPGTESLVNGTANVSVLLIDCTVCPIEPGISRLRVDYVTTAGNIQIDYLDMPFWEGWDNHPDEIQQIADYAKEGIQYIQDEIVILENGVFDALERAQLRGLSVSGTLGATQATNTIQPAVTQRGGAETPVSHNMINAIEFEAKAFNEKTLNLSPKSLVFPYTITDISPSNGLFSGDTINVTIDVTPRSTDMIFLGTIGLPTTISGNTLSATLPSNLTAAFEINLRIATKSGVPLSSDTNIDILALPKITNILGKSFGNVVPGAQFIISGLNFGNTRGATAVTFNPGLSANITVWSPTKIAGIVPLGASNGTVTLITDNGKSANVNTNVLSQNQLDKFEIVPNIVAINPGQTIQFSSLLNSALVSSNWSIVNNNGNIANGNVAFGFIDQTGLYTPPTVVSNTFNINVVCNHLTTYGNVFASTSIIVLAAANTLNLSPDMASLSPNFTQQFVLSDTNGNILPNVSWYVNGLLGGNQSVGLVNQAGLYQAPPIVPSSSSVFITGIVSTGAGTAPIQITPSSNNSSNNSVSHFLDLESKSINSTQSCMPYVTAQYDAVVGQTLNSTAFAMPTNDNGNYYVTAYAQPSCGNQDGIVLVSDGTQGSVYGQLQFTPQTAGFYSIVVYVANGNTSNQYYFLINVTGAPTPQLTSATSSCPGNTITVQGQYFPVDSSIRIVQTNQPMQTTQVPSSIDGLNYSMNVLLPNNLSNTEGIQYTIYLYSPTVGTSNEIEIEIPAGCGAPAVTASLVITPGQTTYIPGGPPIQFIALVEQSNGINSYLQDTIAYVTQTPNGTPIQNGNSQVGTIDVDAGLYTPPATSAGNLTITAQSVYQTSNMSFEPIVGYAYLTPAPTPPVAPTYGTQPSAQESDCIVLNITPTSQDVAVPGQSTQYTCTFNNVTSGQTAIIKPDNWFVNGVAGGDAAHGTITTDGYYTPPEYYPPSDYSETEVGARYTASLSDGTTKVINNYGIIKYYQSIQQSGNCDIQIVSQLNVNFGDGRNGYVPTTSVPVSLLAGNYLLATYFDSLDQDFLPIPNYSAQEMSLSQVSAQSNGLATLVYNQSAIYAIPNAQSGQPQYTSPYTVVLGICDPTSGKFQSMWDEIAIIQPVQYTVSPPLTGCNLMVHEDALTEHLTKKLINIEPIQLPVTKFMWAGKVSFNKNQLIFDDIPKLLSFDNEGHFFKAESVGTKKKFSLKEGQLLALVKGDPELTIFKINESLPGNFYVLGIILGDKFHSLSPFLTVCNTQTNVIQNSLKTNDPNLKNVLTPILQFLL